MICVARVEVPQIECQPPDIYLSSRSSARAAAAAAASSHALGLKKRLPHHTVRGELSASDTPLCQPGTIHTLPNFDIWRMGARF